MSYKYIKNLKEQEMSYLKQSNIEDLHSISSRSMHKIYSFDEMDNAVLKSSILYSFEGADQKFLNPNYSQFADYNTQDLANDFGMIDIQNIEIVSPQTPNSFGFCGSPYREADVELKLQNRQKLFQNVKIYLVNDMMDFNKAGLIFKSEGVEIDLKIQKKQGKELQKCGYLYDTSCQLWMESCMQWIPINVNIKLEARN